MTTTIALTVSHENDQPTGQLELATLSDYLRRKEQVAVAA